MKKTILPLIVVAIALAGCLPFDPRMLGDRVLEANTRALDTTLGLLGVNLMTPRDMGQEIMVNPQITWAAADKALTEGASARWTVDGFGLDELQFMFAIAPGEPLLRDVDVDLKDIVYKTTMLPDDVMEMIAGTLRKEGRQQLRTDALRPAPFGSAMGFRFDLAFTTEDGLQMKGTALFAQRRNKLDVILFTAPAEYYFDRYLPVVEKLFASVRIASTVKAAN